MRLTNAILTKEKIQLNVDLSDKWKAIQAAGRLLVDEGHVDEEYIGKMQEREELLTTYIGNGVAIPHGTKDSKEAIRSTGFSVIQVPEGVDFGDGNTVYLLIGIAAVGDEHLELLSNIATVCSDLEKVRQIVASTSKEDILRLFNEGV